LLRHLGLRGIGKRLRIGSAADIGTRPGEVVGTTARCPNGFAAIEHACGERVKATPRLQSLGPAIKQVLTILQQEVVGSAAFDPSEDDRPFVMATSDVGEVFLLPSLIQTISAKAPQAAIRSVVINPIDLEAALGDGTVDLAVGYFPDLVQATIVQQTLCSHPFTCLARTNHPLIKNR
jgi:DNA-binding transcriptional LysR family regulator